MKRLTLSVVGLQYRVLKPTLRSLAKDMPLKIRIELEPQNIHDSNAIAVYLDDSKVRQRMKIGYLRKEVAAVLHKPMDDGKLVVHSARLTSLDPEIPSAEAEIRLSRAKAVILDKLPTVM